MKRGFSPSLAQGTTDGNLYSGRGLSPIPPQTNVDRLSNAAAANILPQQQRIGRSDDPLNRPNHYEIVELEGTAKRPKLDTENSANNRPRGGGTKQQQQQQPTTAPFSGVVFGDPKGLVDLLTTAKADHESSNVSSGHLSHEANNSGSYDYHQQSVPVKEPIWAAAVPLNSRLTRNQQRASPVEETEMDDQKLPATRKQLSSNDKAANAKPPPKAEPRSAKKEFLGTKAYQRSRNPSAVHLMRSSLSRDLRPKKTKASDDKASPTAKKESVELMQEKINSKADLHRSKGTEAEVLTEASSAIDETIETRTDSEEVVARYVELPPLPAKIPDLPKVKPDEIRELEVALEFGPNSEDTWRDDWSGNLAYADKEISNPVAKGRSSGKIDFKQSLLLWATNGPKYLRLLQNLIRYVYHQKGTPPMAKKILAHANQSSVIELEGVIRRVSYDPAVLRQDGWTTAKSKEMIGATGGPFLIGDIILWQNNEAVIIAYVHDEDHLGDLWKAMYIDDMETFDLEAEELQSARQKWERKQQKQVASNAALVVDNASRRSSRAATPSVSSFSVIGMEHGIVLAASYNPNARQGVFWPARIMHVSEMDVARTQNKRASSRKANVDVVFLAPYWNSRVAAPTSRGRVESFADSMSRHGKAVFSSGPLFEVETIEVSEDQIKPYQFSLDGIDIDQLRVSFRFSGLPKAAFQRFLDSHRLAVALKTFAATELDTTRADSDMASAALFDAHPFAVQTARFPLAILHLPFEYILSQLPQPSIEQPTYSDDDQCHIEAVIDLSGILRAMKPPMCWGKEDPDSSASRVKAITNGGQEAPFRMPMQVESHSGYKLQLKFNDFVQDLRLLAERARYSPEGSPVGVMVKGIDSMLSRFWDEAGSYNGVTHVQRQQLACVYSKNWALTKGIGEEVLSTTLTALDVSGRMLINEWRRANERIYKFFSHHLSAPGFGNKVTIIVTDSRCNLHMTGRGCVERPVRLPVALKAAKQAGAGANDNIQLVTTVDDRYLQFAENSVLPKAHSANYLRRMKNRCATLGPSDIVPMSEDSDGRGGDDTNGSRGTWTAAVAAVATAIYAVDRIVAGECVNAFCAARPPGHHAGRELHPMKAVSNGFCVLNTAACAALYATTPVSEGGPGLRRVCVIDFDVHHGNGTQDILCSTFDPRFLYISLHAGGAHINGYQDKDGEDQEFETLGSRRQEGIYPGRCGDKSPHGGVLNVPLGARVMPPAVGSAMVDMVRPAVDAFAPDLIVISAGFDAHKNDPLGLGGMSAEDFGTLTEVICKLALRICSGRVLSVLEGGYGIPCCSPQENIFLPANLQEQGSAASPKQPGPANASPTPNGQPSSAPQQGAVASNGAPTDVEQPKQHPEVASTKEKQPRASGNDVQPTKILELGEDLPVDMKDEVPPNLIRRLEKCHAEGFMDCVRMHVQSLVKCNTRSE